jgi:hypothetical protein
VRGGGAGYIEIAVNERRRMTKKFKKNIELRRFAACTLRGRLLSIGLRTACCAPVSESGPHFYLSAGCNFRDRFKSVSQKQDTFNAFNALRNFSRESSAAYNSKQKHHLEPRTQLRQTYE